jgi:hypothetical protein
VLGILVASTSGWAASCACCSRRGPELEAAALGDRLGALGHALLAAARDQSIDHAPMLVFTAVADRSGLRHG